MIKPPQVTCDHCAKDITYTTNSVDYRVCLSAESMRPNLPIGGGVVTDMWEEPWPPEPLHFCGPKCFELWVRSKLLASSPE